MVGDEPPAEVIGKLGANLILGERPVHLPVDEADPLFAILSRAHLDVPRGTHEAGQEIGVGDDFHPLNIDENAYESKRKAL